MKYLSAVSSALALLASQAVCADMSKHEGVEAFISEMQQKHQFDGQQLQALFRETRFREDIIEAITRPAEGKPWHDYRPIFLTKGRIKQGVNFMHKHRDILTLAEKEYGVPAQIITAIIGVETFYGRHAGKYRVMDSLATLAFGYPKRADFFRGQLEQFLIMAREENVPPMKMLGSYAGAMGQPQFIPSSFRDYAVDFDGDGHRDLWDNRSDVIGSVANYFKKHKWQAGQPVAARATVHGEAYKAMAEKGYKPSFTVKELKQAGVSIKVDYPDDARAALVELETRQGPEYWVALDNFYVITRYNHSPLYAMAVFQLSEAIRSSMK